jgi:hypothetical protein
MFTKVLGITVAAVFALATPGFTQPALDSPLQDDQRGTQPQDRRLGPDDRIDEGVWPEDRRDTDVEEGVTPRDHDRDAVEIEEDLLRDDETQIEEGVVPGETVVLRPEPARLQPQPNFGVELEGGVSNFTGDLGDALDSGGNWGVRGIFGKASPIGLEAAYFGSANSLAAADETGISSAGELQGRLNIIRSPDSVVQPFVAAGVNYYRIDATGDEAVALDGNDSVESIGFPLSAGVNFLPTENITIGARGNYRILTDLIDDNIPSGDNWNVGLTLGAAF